jgi:DNA modification methylase
MSVQILQGDCRETLKTLRDSSVHCCVTSPPYFGLRDYGHEWQIGLEDSPDAFVAEMVAVFREARRVLREDGTLWLNLGDSYAGGGGFCPTAPSNQAGSKQTTHKGSIRGSIKPSGNIKAKDLIGIPWRVAFALQADGWYLRQDIIWHKPNPMPESVTDRCTKAHEYVFLLTKNERYFYDAEALREPHSPKTHWYSKDKQAPSNMAYADQPSNGGQTGLRKALPNPNGRNRRSVWTVNTSPYKGAHFATFPPDLIRPCILAGCPIGGTVLDPFGGSGTTAQVALEEGRAAILCELNPSYVGLINQRLAGVTPSLFGRVAA